MTTTTDALPSQSGPTQRLRRRRRAPPATAATVVHYYRRCPANTLLVSSLRNELTLAQADVDLKSPDDGEGKGGDAVNVAPSVSLLSVEREQCFNILLSGVVSVSQNNDDDFDGDNNNSHDVVEGDGVIVDEDMIRSMFLEDSENRHKLEWLLGETFEPDGLQLEQSFLMTMMKDADTCNRTHNTWLLEFGPRLTFTSAFSANAVNILRQAGCHSFSATTTPTATPTTPSDGGTPTTTMTAEFASDLVVTVERIEPSFRYLLRFQNTDNNEDGTNGAAAGDYRLPPPTVSLSAQTAIRRFLHDRMTQQEYSQPLSTAIWHDHDSNATKNDPQETTTAPASRPSGIDAVRIIPVLEQGRSALEQINRDLGLGFDTADLEYYTQLFQERLGRNPTDVECFDMGQSNSEHSRHWFFGGKLIIDGQEMPNTLFQMVKATLHDGNRQNSIIAFHDNSSAIQGYTCAKALRPTTVHQAGSVVISEQVLHPLLTAETHNFPTGVAPFPGAETGTGGRLRDVMATGRGAYPVAGICAYCVGRLQLPGEDALPWETELDNSDSNNNKAFVYPQNLATPLAILLDGSDGTSDYGNKYGEPVLGGFTRSFGQRLPLSGARYEWVKPILFSAGVGQLDGRHTTKGDCETGMWIVKLGGPAYRIGIGGGAASSRTVTSGGGGSDDDHLAELDFAAVQRGDAEMENRLNRLMRACCDLGDANPIVSVHDQGAGGNGNVLKEIVEPAGASYDIRKVIVGDNTLSVLELWGAEYQENNAILIRPKDWDLIQAIAERELCPIAHLGHVTGDGRVVVHDTAPDAPVTPVVDLPLELVLGKMPQKTFVDQHEPLETQPLSLPDGVTVAAALDRVLRLVSVGSKRFLMHKVDRSVTGLCAQQQCVGPLQLPLSNVAVTAHTHFGLTGTAVACGEQPIKGLIDATCMARMSVAEAMTNLMWAKISSLSHVKASGNWMYAAKLPGEGAKMYDACQALRDALLVLNVAIDGGKDSLSMAAKCDDEIVKAPGELVLTCYVTCPDITLTVTPDLKCDPERESVLIFVDLGAGHSRLGGSALAQVYNQVGTDSPDVSDFTVLKSSIEVVQQLIQDRTIWAGHDRSDGGLIVTLLEMAISGNCGIDVNVPPLRSGVIPPKGTPLTALEILFAEEAGFVLQVAASDANGIVKSFQDAGVTDAAIIGFVSVEPVVKVAIGGTMHLEASTADLRDIWEATSFALEKRQRNPSCVAQEQAGLKRRKAPQWTLTYEPKPTPASILDSPVSQKHKVAILRQEGSNGDREMIAAFLMAGFDAWDVTMTDLLRGDTTLDQFRGIAFVGGFSFADVLDSGKGWGGVIKFNPSLWQQFEQFRHRPDTFSLGVCNGCQLMAVLGWVPSLDNGISQETKQPQLLRNESGKFESWFSTAVMLRGMGGSTLGHTPSGLSHRGNGPGCHRNGNDNHGMLDHGYKCFKMPRHFVILSGQGLGHKNNPHIRNLPSPGMDNSQQINKQIKTNL